MDTATKIFAGIGLVASLSLLFLLISCGSTWIMRKVDPLPRAVPEADPRCPYTKDACLTMRLSAYRHGYTMGGAHEILDSYDGVRGRFYNPEAFAAKWRATLNLPEERR